MFKVIYSFDVQGRDGFNPFGLTADSTGTLFGTTNGACGSVFQLSNDGLIWSIDTLYHFNNGADGCYPWAGVTFGPDRNLYGTTVYGGGGAGSGVTFKLTNPGGPAGSQLWPETILHRFGVGATMKSSQDGAWPESAPIFDASGNAYGTTLRSGPARNGPGIVYELIPAGSHWVEKILSNSAGCCGVIFGSDGNLYGVDGAGAYGYGEVWELVRSGNQWTKQTLYNFRGQNDGAGPSGVLVFDQQGNLYGMTNECYGAGGGGTFYELSPSGGTWNFTVLYSFPKCGPADMPYGLVIDSNGNLYGSSFYRGEYDSGMVFELSPSGNSWIFSSLHDFTGQDDGAYPMGLTLAPNGKLYGVAGYGGNLSGGTVFEITLPAQ